MPQPAGSAPPLSPRQSLSRIAREARREAQSRSRCNDVAGAAHHSVPDMLLGQRSDPASPAVHQAPDLNQQKQGDLVMIHITRNDARCKGLTGRFTCGIIPHVGKWSAPAANEVAP